MIFFLVAASIAYACLRIAKMFVCKSTSQPSARSQYKEIDKLSLYIRAVGVATCNNQHNPGAQATRSMAKATAEFLRPLEGDSSPPVASSVY